MVEKLVDRFAEATKGCGEVFSFLLLCASQADSHRNVPVCGTEAVRKKVWLFSKGIPSRGVILLFLDKILGARQDEYNYDILIPCMQPKVTHSQFSCISRLL